MMVVAIPGKKLECAPIQGHLQSQSFVEFHGAIEITDGEMQVPEPRACQESAPFWTREAS
jgi:hypothetical protein